MDGKRLFRYNKRKKRRKNSAKGVLVLRRKKKHTDRSAIYYASALLLCILVVSLVMGSYLSFTYYKKSREDFYENNELYLNSIVRSHENELKIFSDIATQLEMSDNTKFLLEDQPTKAAELKNQLHQYRSVNQFFDVMYSFYQKDHYVFNHSTSMELDLFCRTAYLCESVSEEGVRTLLLQPLYSLYIIPEQKILGDSKYSYDNSEKDVTYFVPMPPSYSGILIFLVGGSHYDTLLEDDPENLRNTYLIFGGKIIVSRGSCEIPEEEVLSCLPSEDGQEEVSLNGSSYMMTARTGDSGILYLSLQSESVFSGSLLANAGWIFLLLLCVPVPVVIIAVVLSRRMLKRVKNINQLLSDDSENSYGFGSIESGINELVTRSESMKEDQLSYRKSRFVTRFLCSEYTAMEILRRDASEAQIDLHSGHYLVGILGCREDGNANRFFEMILDFLKNTKEIDGYGFHPFHSEQLILVIFGDRDEILYQSADRIHRIGKESFGECIAAVSWHHTSMLNGSAAFLEASSAYDSRFLMDNSQVICFKETGQNASITRFGDLRNRYMVQLENTIRVGNEKEVEQAIRNLCLKLDEERVPLLTFRLLYDEILRFLMEQWNGNEKDWNQVYNVFSLSKCLTMEDFSALLTEACRMLLDTKTDPQQYQSEVIRKAEAIMQESFSNPDLNMTFLAESLGISAVTLAVDFKNEIGMNPSDYLAMIRLDHARELLKDTQMLVKDVSLAVGYEDFHVFIRRFKNYTGLTPGQYRKENSDPT